MIELFQKYINEKELFSRESFVIAAVSGGLDSVCLCYLLKNAGYNFAIAHCNFGLRGEESEQDQKFAEQLSEILNVPFFTKKFDTKPVAQAEKVSIQMAARTLRYNWFEELAIKHNADKILTAHHKNDIAETILLNLTRGTGIAGLHGIKPKQGILARPLLFATREEIHEFVQQKDLTWREDSSNISTKYKRNFIRHKVIPLFKELNPNFENTLEETIEKISFAEALFADQIENYKVKSLYQKHDHWVLAINNLSGTDKDQIILFELLKPFGFSYEQCKSIFSTFSQIPGKVFESQTHILVKDREQLIITLKNKQSDSIQIQENSESVTFNNTKIQVKQISAKGYTIDPSKDKAAIDLDKVSFPLEIRTWQQGDRFFPLGMKNRKKISDYLINTKIPLNLKEQAKVLVSNNEIVWLIGYRLDDRFKITSQTTKILEIALTI